MVAAVDRVWLGPFDVAERAGGKPQYRQPLLMPEAIASRLAAKSDWTVRALASDLQAEAVVVPHDMVWRFLRHQGFSIKKRCSRAMCRIYQPRLDPTRLVFIDETWVKTKMTRTRGWSPRGTPLIAKVPHGHWKTLTFLAALTHDRIVAPCVIGWPNLWCRH